MRGQTRSTAERVLHRAGYAVAGRGTSLPALREYTLHQARLPEPSWSRPRVPVAFEVDLHRVTTACGFSYAADGWHPYRAALAQVLADPARPLDDTVLTDYYARFRPRNVREALVPAHHGPVPPLDTWPTAIPLVRLPWGVTRRQVAGILEAPPATLEERQHVGPRDGAFVVRQVERLVEAHRSFTDHGYAPELHSDGHLVGYFLVRDDDYRFVVLHGNHRLAAMEVHGILRPQATLMLGHPPVVHRDQLARWDRGPLAVMPASTRELLFDAMFDATGRDRAAALGLV